MSGHGGHRRGGQNGRWKGWRLGPEAPAPGARMPTKRRPMTEAQAGYVRTLCDRAGEPFDAGWTKAQASARIDALKRQSGRTKGRPA